jgi:hypothetical protein
MTTGGGPIPLILDCSQPIWQTPEKTPNAMIVKNVDGKTNLGPILRSVQKTYGDGFVESLVWISNVFGVETRTSMESFALTFKLFSVNLIGMYLQMRFAGGKNDLDFLLRILLMPKKIYHLKYLCLHLSFVADIDGFTLKSFLKEIAKAAPFLVAVTLVLPLGLEHKLELDEIFRWIEPSRFIVESQLPTLRASVHRPPFYPKKHKRNV